VLRERERERERERDREINGEGKGVQTREREREKRESLFFVLCKENNVFFPLIHCSKKKEKTFVSLFFFFPFSLAPSLRQKILSLCGVEHSESTFGEWRNRSIKGERQPKSKGGREPR